MKQEDKRVNPYGSTPISLPRIQIMINLRKIIKEAIDNQILFGDLNFHMTRLHRFNEGLKRPNAKNNQEIGQFLNELYIFTEEVIKALNRCISKKSLNEGYNNGFEDVPLYSDIYNSIARGLNKDVLGDVKNTWDVIRGKQSVSQNGNQRYGNVNIPKNQTLQVLLSQYYPPLEQKYIKLNKKYNNAVENMNPPNPKYIIKEINEIINTINKAQGMNP